MPLAKMDFRVSMRPRVTCSDASATGGGICVTQGTTPFGSMAAQGLLRGQIPEHRSDHRVLTIGLFDGIAALRVALDALAYCSIGHVSVEKEASARPVVEARFPDTLRYHNAELITEEEVADWQGRFSQASVVIIGGGPPCQSVSGLNSDRLGALRDLRSNLFHHVSRIRGLVQQKFCWCQVHALMESVASMDVEDQQIMSKDFGSYPWECDAGTLTWCSRPRLYWVTWELRAGDGVELSQPTGESPGKVVLQACQDLGEVCQEGWWNADNKPPAGQSRQETSWHQRMQPGGSG